MLIGRAIAILAILCADAVPILGDFSGDPMGLRERGDHVADQLRLANAARVSADDDQSPARGSVHVTCTQALSSPASRGIVYRWLTFWSGIPPPVHPYPLFRILADNPFNHLRKYLRVLQDVPLCVACSNQLHRRLKAQPVLPNGLVPNRVARDNRCASMQRHARNSGSRAGWLPEEIHERCFFRHSVLV